jgi:hypothetical protein
LPLLCSSVRTPMIYVRDHVQLQASVLGEVQALTPGEAEVTQATNEGQVEWP